jgi:hypothetical protein
VKRLGAVAALVVLLAACERDDLIVSPVMTIGLTAIPPG